jgi:hypothetical protein
MNISVSRGTDNFFAILEKLGYNKLFPMAYEIHSHVYFSYSILLDNISFQTGHYSIILPKTNDMKYLSRTYHN